MNARLGLVLSLVACASAVWLWRPRAEPAPPLGLRGAGPTAAAEQPAPDGAAVPSAEPRLAATDAEAFAVPPLPVVTAAALRVDVLVVRHATGEPVADADVTWDDDRCRALLAGLGPPQRERVHALGGLAWHGRTDARGIVTVHLDAVTYVQARKDNLSGSLECDRQAIPPDGHCLRLYETNALRVRVLDADGQPAPDVDLGLTRESDHHTHHLGARARTDAAGLAAFDLRWELQEAGVGSGDQPPLQWIVRANIVGDAVPHRTFDPKVAGEQLVELRLPPCGRVRARLAAAGLVVPVEFDLRAIGTSDQARPLVRRAGDAASEAVFPWVELGRELEVEARLAGETLRQQVPPLQQVGAERVVVLALAPERATYRFRLVDEQQRPLAATEFCYALLGGEQPGKTDAGGWFADLGPESMRGRRPSDLRIWIRAAGQPPRHAVRKQLALGPGLNQLGDLAVLPLPVLVAARFVHAGQPVPASEGLLVERYVDAAAGSGAEPWQPLGSREVQVVDGKFVCYGHAEPGRHRLQLIDDEWLPMPPVEFVPGATDVVIDVTPAHPLLASLLVPADSGDGLRVSLQPQRVAAAPDPERLRPWVGEAVGGRREVQWRGLPPGTYALEVRLLGFADLLARLEDVQVPPSFPPDPRLAIDLRQSVESLSVRAEIVGEDPAGRSGDDLLFVMPPAQDPAPAFEFWADEVRLLVPARPVELLVVFAGCQPQRIAAARGTVRARVVPLPSVEVALADAAQVPDGFQLELRLQGGGEQLHYRLRDDVRTLDLDVPGAAPITLDGGRATLAVGTRAQRLCVRLVRERDGQYAPLDRCEPATVLAGPAPIALRLDGDEVRAAVAAMR